MAIRTDTIIVSLVDRSSYGGSREVLVHFKDHKRGTVASRSINSELSCSCRVSSCVSDGVFHRTLFFVADGWRWW